MMKDDGGSSERTKSQAAGEPRRLAYMELDHHKLDSITRPAVDDEGWWRIEWENQITSCRRTKKTCLHGTRPPQARLYNKTCCWWWRMMEDRVRKPNHKLQENQEDLLTWNSTTTSSTLLQDLLLMMKDDEFSTGSTTSGIF